MENNTRDKYKPEDIDIVIDSGTQKHQEIVASLNEKISSNPNITDEEKSKLVFSAIDDHFALQKQIKNEINESYERQMKKRLEEQSGLDTEDIFVTNEYISHEKDYKKVPFFLFKKRKTLKDKMEGSKRRYEEFRLKKREVEKSKMDEKERALADELDIKTEKAKKLKDTPFYKFADRQKLKELRKEIGEIYSRLLEYRDSKFDTRTEEEKGLSGLLKKKTEEFSSTPIYKFKDRKDKSNELADTYSNLLDSRNKNN